MNILDLIRPPEINSDSRSIAIIHNDKEISYSEINSLIDKTSGFLIEKGIKENDIAALAFENSPDFIVAILSLWQIGAIPVPLNSKLLPEDLNEQIKFLKAKLTIKSKSPPDVSPHGENITITFDDLPDSENNLSRNDFSEEKTALILFTSGSSGNPKAVMLSFNNLIQSALIGNKVLNHNDKDRWLASLPFYHIGGFSIFFRALMFRIPVIIPDSFSTEDLIKSISNHHPTLTSLVSNQLKNLIDKKYFIPPEELRMVLFGGGFANQQLILTAIKKGWKIAKVYGSTETSSFVTIMNTEEVLNKPGASGKAVLPNIIIITDEGEIAVKSPAVMKGYFKDIKETSSKLKNGFYYTGDIGYFDDEGYLFVEAKRNDLIITGGENVNPAEVEGIILSHPAIKEVCVVGVEDEKWGQVISAAVVLNEGFESDENEFVNFLKDKLASFKIPKKIIFTGFLPKTELGKVLKEDVRKLFNIN